MKPGRPPRALLAVLGAAILMLAGLLLASCASEGEGETRRIDWKLSDSLGNYGSVEISLLDADDTSKVLAVVHAGKLENPASLADYTLPDSISGDFVILIRGFDGSGLLAFESRTGVEDGKAGTPKRTPTEDLPAGKSTKSTRLAGLDFSNGTLTPAFKPDVFTYVLDVPFQVSFLKLSALAADSDATLDLGGKPLVSGAVSDSIRLLVGKDNLFTVTVRAKGGAPSQAYSITVKRAPGNLARLASLTLSAGELAPEFSPDTLDYEARIPVEAESVAVTAAAQDPRAHIEIGGQALDTVRGRLVILKRGASATLQISVLSQDSSSRIQYTLKLTRAQSADATLKSLFVTGVELAPEFMADHLTYGAQIAQDQFAVLPVSRDTGATIRVDGVAVRSGALSGLLASPAVGQAKVVQVEVTAADKKTVRTYSLSLIRVAATTSLIGMALTSSGTAIALDSPFVASRLAYQATAPRSSQKIRLSLAFSNISASSAAKTKVSLGDSTLPLVSTSTNLTVVTALFDGILQLGMNVLKVELDGGSTFAIRILRERGKSANLASLFVSAGTLKPAFRDTVTAYTDTVLNAAATLSITAAPKDTNASRLIVSLKRQAPLIVKVETPLVLQKGSAQAALIVAALPYRVYAVDTLIPGKPSKALDLAVGHNLVEVEVTAEDTTVKRVYSVAVERRPSSNAYLADLVVSTSAGTALTLDPAFSDRTILYAITTTTGFVTVKPVGGETGQAITVAGKAVASGAASESITLAAGTQDIPVVVTAPDKSTTVTYTLRITKKIILRDPIIKEPIEGPIP